MAKKEENALIVPMTGEVPDYLRKFDADDKRGSENVTKDDIIIPRLGLVQALSPETKKKEPEYIEGIEQGQLFNTVTREIYGSEVLIVPVYFDKPYLLWRDRDSGGGFGGQYLTMEEAEEAIAGQDDPDKWEATDTPTHICLVISGDKVNEIAIPMPRSKAKISRQLNSIIRMVGGPRFSRVYKVSGVEEKNSKNQDFWNFKIEMVGYPSEQVLAKAEKLYEDIASGSISYKMDTDDIRDTEGADSDSGEESF